MVVTFFFPWWKRLEFSRETKKSCARFTTWPHPTAKEHAIHDPVTPNDIRSHSIRHKSSWMMRGKKKTVEKGGHVKRRITHLLSVSRLISTSSISIFIEIYRTYISASLARTPDTFINRSANVRSQVWRHQRWFFFSFFYLGNENYRHWGWRHRSIRFNYEGNGPGRREILFFLFHIILFF